MSEIIQPASTPAPKSTNTMAILSLVAGIAGLSFVPFLGSIIAVILGPIAKREIAASAGAQTGEGLATAGTILGWVGIGVTVLGACITAVLVLLPLLLGLGIWSVETSSTSLLALAAFV
jgi:Domain of unknown function (DUF4190)